jgi:4'-phosphopantetheinyl transferase
MSAFMTARHTNSREAGKGQNGSVMPTKSAGVIEGVRVRMAECPAAFARAPQTGEVFAWVIDLARPPVGPEELLARLTPEEKSRAARYKIAKAREQFVTCRGLLRGLLGDFLGIEPGAVPLAYLPSGKPVLGAGEAIHFNVTHTDGIAVLAAGRRRVGVDVERVREVADAEGLVGRYFSASEAAAFRSLPPPERTAAFFRGWTCKEAVIKAAGATVSCLADFDVELHPRRAPRVNAVRDPLLAGDGWALAEWRTPDGAAIALAVEGAAELRLEVEPPA